MHDLSTTLVAVATAPGRGGIGCVRLSGSQSLGIARRLVRRGASRRLAHDGRVHFVTFLDSAGERLDHGFIVAFGAGFSYTGELAVELWAHGSPPVLEELVAGAVLAGATRAGPGEFTYRALRHGRLDLAKAEAVRDLIAARTLVQARAAFSQVEGALSRRVQTLRERLIDLLAHGEAAVEFVDESETELETIRFVDELDQARNEIAAFVAASARGRLARDGARVILAGRTSVGKSSIFNSLLGIDRAIVSSAPGTTRDTLDESLDLGGIPVVLVDTAGLRPVADQIEAEGVRRARQAAGEGDLVLLVLDASRSLLPDEIDALNETSRPTIVVANKADVVGPDAAAGIWPGALAVSASTGFGMDVLREAIRRRLTEAAESERPVVTHGRHHAALEACAAALDRARRAANDGVEFALEEIRDALRALGEIIGEVPTDDLYDRIFTTFCIGK
jgi:tRNA modification GTPase